jgi:putative DNA modification/repair radical SAM protein
MEIDKKIRILCEASKFDTCLSSSSNRSLSFSNQSLSSSNQSLSISNRNSLSSNRNSLSSNRNSLSSNRNSLSSNRNSLSSNRIGSTTPSGICHSFSEDGRCISLFKTLMTNKCIYDCKYCSNSTSSTKVNTSFTSEEIAKITLNLYFSNHIEGLFLSSGICGEADATMQNMIDAASILRNKYHFEGYIHLKVLPGTSKEYIKQVAELADRISINLEAPNSSRMSDITGMKDYKIDILRRQSWIKNMKIPAGHTTQLVVGGSDETDKEIISMAHWEYNNLNLKRAYYSAFIPVKGTPFEIKNKVSLERENRLYNVDFMFRKYGIKKEEIFNIMNDDFLPKGDPKKHIATNHFDSPVDINQSSFDDLIRIPGIGLRSAQRIKELQDANRNIESRQELHSLGVVLKRAEPFIKIGGYVQRRLDKYGMQI